MFAHGETVTRLRATATTDPYSGDTSALDWSNPTQLGYSAAVALGGTSEPLQDARDQVDSDFDLYMPADADVTSADRMLVRGQVCNVVGRPFLWRNPFSGWTPGLFVQTQLREG